MSDAPRPKATVYVGGLTSAVDSHTLHNAFIPFGPIVNISLPKPELPSNPEPHRGFGYVEFESPQESELFGRVIKVNLAKEQKAEGEGLGSKTAIWEQVSILVKVLLLGKRH
jgi:RNA recognition motif-containing protein